MKNPHPLFAAVLGQESTAPVVAVVEREIDCENLDLENVSRLRALDVDGTGEDVASRPLVLHLLGDTPERRFDVTGGDASRLQPARRRSEERPDLDDVTRAHPKDRHGMCIVVSPRHGLGRGKELVRLLG